MTRDMLSEFDGRCGDVTFCQFIDNQLMAFEAGFPFGLLHALAEALKEDVQQITEFDERMHGCEPTDRSIDYLTIRCKASVCQN
jgi:hypothetical protein